MSELAVSVIIPAFNAAATIERVLEALVAQDVAEPYEVIVVDNGSTDGTAELAERGPGSPTVIRRGPASPGEWRAPGASRNLAARQAQGRVLAFTDADCFPGPGWLREGLEAMRSADLVQGRVEADPEVRRGPFDRTLWVLRESGQYETANLFVSRELFHRIGGFEDWLRWRNDRPIGEDAWFGWRARRTGARTAFSESAVAYHAVFPRGARDYVADRERYGWVAAVTRKIPELRDHLYYRRLFLTTRTAEFDLALLGMAAAILVGVLVAPLAALLPLLAVVPYGRTAWRRARRYGRRAPLVVGVDLVADAVGLGFLAWGSIRHRSVVL